MFENRKIKDTLNDCLLSVDGTDFRLAMSYVKEFYSHKFKDMGLRYEVGLNIKTGDICWIYGPFEPGKYNDDMIFNMALRGDLEYGEKVETDKGYRGSVPSSVNCPSYEVPERRAMSTRVRNRHETCNRRFKRWNILKVDYRHDILDHGAVFGAVIVLTQLSFENGEPLFSVDYEDMDPIA